MLRCSAMGWEMADVQTRSESRLQRQPHRQTRALPFPDQVALVFQRGGALASYQAGVIEALVKNAIEINWVARISMGAVNAAIVAGNSPERQLERLRVFWEKVTSALPSVADFPNDQLCEWLRQSSAGFVLATGVPGLFSPRPISQLLAFPVSSEVLSFYDTPPLMATLDELIDWDLLNDGPVTPWVGAVDVENGSFRYVDTADERLDARHIMASGALPPRLPPIEIDGRWWWDGGLVSHTPLAHGLHNRADAMLVFQVDVFSALDERPRTLMDVVAREKKILFSGRTRQITDEMMRLRMQRAQIRKVLAKLPETLADDSDVMALAAQAAEKPVSLVHLIFLRAHTWEGGARDFEFSALPMREYWGAGRTAVGETMANARLPTISLMAALPPSTLPRVRRNPCF